MSQSAEKYSKRGIQTSFVSVIIGISLVLFMLGLLIGAYLGLENLQNSAKEKIEVDLFFQPELNNADIKFVEQELKSFEEIKTVWFVSPDRALAVFKDDNSAQIDEIKEIYNGESPFPPSITFNPKAAVSNTEGLANLKIKLLKTFQKELAEVNYPVEDVKNVNLGFLRWAYIFAVIGILLTIVAFAIINNTIRLALYSKRFTIKTMQLVGAKLRFIRSPFIWQSILQGILSAVIGMALLMAAFYTAKNYFQELIVTYEIFTFLLLFASLLVIGIFISVFSTWFALNKYLRKSLNDLY
ncbi:MAG: cell division protein FtsX [Lishizhenia sp.]